MTTTSLSAPSPIDEGFVMIDGEGFYTIPAAERLAPFLMSIVSDSDHWMFVSSHGGLTAGRRDASLALFPYETDDRLHRAEGTTGPVTAIRSAGGALWTPLRGVLPNGAERRIYKAVAGNQVIFEEVHPGLGLAFRYRWANSAGFGFVRTATISNVGPEDSIIEVVDGLVNVLPFGLEPALYRRMNNLTNAYKRSELADPDGRLAVFSLESRVVDRPEPAEALIASTVWSTGFPGASVGVSRQPLDAFEAGRPVETAGLVTGRPGAYLLTGTVALAAGQSASWRIVADVDQDQRDVAALRRLLGSDADVEAQLAESVQRGAERLVAMMAGSDGLQRTGDRIATAHQLGNVTFNVMRGGTFPSGYRLDPADFAEFVAVRNGSVAAEHAALLDALPDRLDRREFLENVEGAGDAQLSRLALEYLPLCFSRRHGDPSRPWNEFSIQVRDDNDDPIIHYEGNWRDIFQNWEGLALSFPEYLPGFVSVFVNASTLDGFNPYRITRAGIDWEVPEPDDPWSNIGYWGDHQIVYLLRLLEATRRFLPGELEAMLDRTLFSYADVPYRIVPYEEIVRDPKATIRFDEPAAARIDERVEEIGSDGRLVWGPNRQVYLVTLLEKLLVPALSKLSNYVPGGGIWMNTQRPEWNDANNALVGFGLSMVTLCHLRRYLQTLEELIGASGVTEVGMSIEVSDWLTSIAGILGRSRSLVGGEVSDRSRKDVMDELGWAFFGYRSRVYASGPSGLTPVPVTAVLDLCEVALAHLDDTIRRNRRPDGLYQSYNLVEFQAEGAAAGLERLPEMLEGQVAVLSSGLLNSQERADVVDALFASPMYDEARRSFMLYPARELPPFLEKNVVPAELVDANPLLAALSASDETSVIAVDAEGRLRFDAAFRNSADLETALGVLAEDDRWGALVGEWGEATLAAYEEVFHHHRFTGRSGSMYAYEGIGSIYWHMVAKLLVAVQEAVLDARQEGATPETTERLVRSYWRVRAGLGFNKTAGEYGAFPTDPYSHTPAHAGAQQPGMTGQVKEELLTRLLETGVRIVDGEVRFDSVLLRPEELLDAPETWLVDRDDGTRTVIELPAGSLGMTLCQVPVILGVTTGSASTVVVRRDGSEHRVDGLRLGPAISRGLFGRTGEIDRIHVLVPSAEVGEG